MTTKEVREKIAEIIKAENEKTENLKTQSAEINQKITALEDQKERYKLAGDFEMYQETKKEIENLKDKKEIAEYQLNAISAGKSISEDEYKEMTAAVVNDFEALENKTFEKLIKAGDQIIEAAQKIKEARETSNELLTVLQNDIYKNRDRIRYKEIKGQEIFDSIFYKDNTKQIERSKTEKLARELRKSHTYIYNTQRADVEKPGIWF